MDEILVDFKSESKQLIKRMIAVLDQIEGDFAQRAQLENFGQIVDRIMGGAETLALVTEKNEQVNMIGRYAQICKLVGYKASQLDNEQMFHVVVGFLLDASEMLDQIVENLGTPQEVDLKTALPKTFLDRLNWIADKFDKDLRASVAVGSADAQNSTMGDQVLIKDVLKGIGIR